MVMPRVLAALSDRRKNRVGSALNLSCGILPYGIVEYHTLTMGFLPGEECQDPCVSARRPVPV